MVSKTIKITLVVLSLFFLAGLALAETKELELAPVITGIEIRGIKNASKKDILDAVFSRVGDQLVEEKVKADLKAIYGLGCFTDVSSSFEAYKNGTKVVFNVVENPIVSQIIFEGNTVYSSGEIYAMISTRAGELLNYKKLQADIDKVNTQYKTAGYMLARVVDVDTDNQTGTLRFKIIEGVVESIALDGNEATHDDIILRELKTTPGTVLNEEVLKKDLRRVFNLGFFSEVTPNFETGSTKDKVVLQLNIKETRTSTVNFGGGYGEREGWFGFVDLSINNLMGTAQGLLLRGQSGQELSTYQFKYYNPWFWPARLGDHAGLTFRRWLTIGRDIFLNDQSGRYNGFDFSLTKPIRDNFNVTYSLGSENVSPYSTSTFEAYRSDTLGLSFSLDTRDFWLNPKEGRYYTLDLRQGWKVADSATTNFSKVGVDLNNYSPLFSNQVFAVHGGVGLGIGDVPIGEVYWAGGANTVRGYYPTEAHKGKRKLLLNAEYRLNFSDMFQGVFFYDYGNAWDSGNPNWNNFLSGWGPGVRVTTPLGPIRLDWGVPAGRTFGEGIMHFSIGQAF